MITLPSDEILLKYASGVLDPALRLLVERHIALHPQTAERLAAFEDFGGLLLASETPAAMTGGSLDGALARIAASPPPAPAAAASWPALDDLSWRWAGPGRAIAPVAVEDSTMKTFAIRIAPGRAMLEHSHVDHEWTLIVQGAYRDESGEFHTGAWIEEDEATVHTPVATGDVDCICLAVMSGPLKVPGFTGRIANWLMR
jgi:putative transcriptional regulator